jgi:hypothetical protein
MIAAQNQLQQLEIPVASKASAQSVILKRELQEVSSSSHRRDGIDEQLFLVWGGGLVLVVFQATTTTTVLHFLK